MIPMDGKLIQQVLINLLDNALKHTRPQEEMTLTLRREQNEAVFTVQDEGEGSPRRISNIFSRLFIRRAHAGRMHSMALVWACRSASRSYRRITERSAPATGLTDTARNSRSGCLWRKHDEQVYSPDPDRRGRSADP